MCYCCEGWVVKGDVGICEMRYPWVVYILCFPLDSMTPGEGPRFVVEPILVHGFLPSPVTHA